MSMVEPRLRIAILTRHFGRHKGGAENYAVSLAEQLAEQHEVHVFCQTEFNALPAITTHVMGWLLNKPRWLNMLLFSLWTRRQTRHGFDIVHSHENVFHGNVQTFHVKPVTHNLFHGQQGMRLALTWLKVLLSPRLLSYLAVERARVRKPDHKILITASQLLKDLYVRTFALRPTDVQVLTPGVSVVATSADKQEQALLKNKCKQDLHLPQDKKLLLMVGHNYQKKGLAVLLQALVHLPPQLALVVVGDTHQIPTWQLKAQQLGVSDRVFFLGQQRQMDQVYQACDVFVHATLEDVFPIVVLEAMSHGLPVVVSPAPYCLSSNLLTHQKEAWVLTDPRDGQELATALMRIDADPVLAKELTRHALIFVQQYSWDHLVQQQIHMYRKLLSRPA